MSVLVIRSRRVVTREGVRPASVHVHGGRIADVRELDDIGKPSEIVDAGEHVVMPGLVDTHVHVNEPGRSEWEGFDTATRAAAAGGVTTLLDMPLNSIPATTSVEALETKRAAAQGRCHVDVGFIGGVVPGNAAELEPLRAAGVLAFKCFLVPSGVDEFPAVGEPELHEALPALAPLGVPLMVHAEHPGAIVSCPSGDGRNYASYLACRPPEAERDAVELMVGLAERYRAAIHIVHLSSASSLDAVRAGRERGVKVTVETCPHYLTFAAEEIPDGATEFKCAPPIRSRGTREALWDALERGEIDLIASDHSPCPPELKRRDSGDFHEAWGGISSLQLGLSAVWTGARSRGLGVERIAEWMCDAPALLAGLGGRKGRIVPGHEADLVIWDPDAEFVVEESALHSRHTLTPYLGRTLRGVVLATYVRGRAAYEQGRFAPPGGRLLPQPDAWSDTRDSRRSTQPVA